MDEPVHLIPKIDATLRTKNRIREHDSHGWRMVGSGTVSCLHWREALKLECPCGWYGWIPVGEVELRNGAQCVSL